MANRTQVEVESKIDRYIELAAKAEFRRDRCEYESAEYWKHHDIATKHHESARRLMPRGS